MKDKTKLLVAVGLIYPYKVSMEFFMDLCSIWSFPLYMISTKRQEQYIYIPKNKFKKIWNEEPKVGVLTVPSGTEDYIQYIEILKIIE